MQIDTILAEMEKVCFENLSDEYKKHIIDNYWNIYYEKRKNMDINQNNEQYIIDFKEITPTVNEESLKKALSNQKNNELKEEDIYVILDWVVSEARKNIYSFGIVNEKSTLEGYCEIAQFLTMYRLEKLGLNITKNNTRADFDISLNHSYGTVTFDINGVEKSYLIDLTFKQFFTKYKCNKAREYVDGVVGPDPGYYIKNKAFANMLISNGYIELNEFTSKMYCESFFKSYKKELMDVHDYKKILLSSKEGYSCNHDEVEDLLVYITK